MEMPKGTLRGVAKRSEAVADRPRKAQKVKLMLKKFFKKKKDASEEVDIKGKK